MLALQLSFELLDPLSCLPYILFPLSLQGADLLRQPLQLFRVCLPLDQQGADLLSLLLQLPPVLYSLLLPSLILLLELLYPLPQLCDYSQHLLLFTKLRTLLGTAHGALVCYRRANELTDGLTCRLWGDLMRAASLPDGLLSRALLPQLLRGALSIWSPE